MKIKKIAALGATLAFAVPLAVGAGAVVERRSALGHEVVRVFLVLAEPVRAEGRADDGNRAVLLTGVAHGGRDVQSAVVVPPDFEPDSESGRRADFVPSHTAGGANRLPGDRLEVVQRNGVAVHAQLHQRARLAE